MAPRNVADAMARAVTDLEREVGMPVDSYVAKKLGWSKDDLKKRFSAAQAEAVALFVRNMENRGTGLINSDQTGVGKGRSVAAVIHYALKNGKIPIFITAKKQLYSDMAGRDLPNIGITDFNPFITDSEVEWTNGKGDSVNQNESARDQREAMAEITRTGKLPPGVHGIFTTYEQLKGDKPQGWKEEPKATRRRKKNFQPRPDGPRFAMLRKLAPNAIFVLDEAHQAAGLDSESGLSLQSILPQAAGTYYASATFAKRPDNLNLYALGTAMKKSGLSRKEFGDAFAAGGVPLQQALTAMLAESGEFVRREQNMEEVDFKFKATGTDPEKEAELADTYTSFLRDLFPLSNQVKAAASSIVDNENQVRPEGEEVDLSSVNFGARLFNLSSQYLLSLRTDATVQEALTALKNNQKPFIALYNTMAGPIADLQKRNLPVNFAGMLEREMQKMLEVMVKDPNSPGDPKNNVPKGKRLIILKPEDLPDGGRYYYQLRDQIRATDFSQMPISPIDTIKNAIKKAGYTIGELTGRPGEVEETNDTVKITPKEKQERNKILADFNNGRLDALVVNASADTGVSAHAAPEFKDQRQRHLIVAQPNPDINGFMQILGRVMRFGQTKVPTNTIISSSLATERRFNTMLRSKLKSLNANTTADTESGITQGGLTEDIFNPIGDAVVAQVMSENPDLADLALIDLPDPSEPESLTGYARRATGYFVLLPNADAEHLWSEISDNYRATIKALDDAGENPLKADVVDLRAKTTKSQVIQEGTGKTLFDGPVTLETTEVKPPQPALTSQQALDLARQGRGAAEAKADEWLSKFPGMRQRRLEVMRQRESTDTQINAADENFLRTKDAVEHAVRLIGEPIAVMSASGEGVDFYAVPIGLMLKSENPGDFSGASKHSLVLATNSIRRQVTLPLSQLPRIQQATIQAFDSERDQSGVRQIITGNLLRGVKDALKMAQATARPKVTIYSTSDNQVKTGVLMGPGWKPESGLRALGKVLSTAAEMRAAIDSGKLITAGPVLIRGMSFSVPSRNEFRAIWSDPAFGRLFDKSPIEKRGYFEGQMNYNGYNTVYDFLKSKGIAPTLQTTDEGGKLSVTLSEAPSTGVTPQDIQNAFPAEQGFVVKPVSINWTGEQESVGYLVKLPNGELMVIDPTHEKIAFNVEKAAADWGIDPRLLAERGIARGKYTAGGVTINGVEVADLIDLLKTSGPDILSHEKFHFLFNMALTPQERAAILKRYGTEEKAAEAFRRSEGFTRSFWEKIKRFLEWLANLFRGDAFKKMRQKLSTEPSTPETPGEQKLSLETEMRNPRQFEERLAKPITSPEEAISLKRQAGAGAGLVPDEIAGEIRNLNPADPIEKRVADELDFILKLHGVAPALDLQGIITNPNIPDDTKQAAISNVLRQIEHVRDRTETLQEQLQEADTRLAGIVKNGERITAKKLVADQAKTIADNLISRYRQYLTAQAASLPANQNVAATKMSLIRGLEALLNQEQKLPSATIKAITAIAEHIGELPVKQGPQAVMDAIRQKGFLRSVAGEDTIDLLTAEKPGGFPPLLASPEAGAMLQDLASLQKKSATYAKQIEVIEEAFRGKGPPTPVEVKKFADTYRKFRNKQAEAAKIIAEHDKDFAKADEDVQVYGRSHETLTRLQQDPQFQSQLETALDRPGGEVLRNIYRTGKAKEGEPVNETVFVSPLKQQDEEGKELPPNEYRIKLAPNRAADNATIEQMRGLLDEIDRFLDGENGPVDPLERRTWEQKRDYIAQYVQRPQFLLEDAGSKWANPFEYGQLLLGNLATAMRPELASIGLRAAEEANKNARVADQAGIGYKLIANNKEFGDAATDVAVIKAVESHKWPLSQIEHWNQYVLNPIIAAGQTAGQMRLKNGDYIPGTTIRITPEDMRVATMEKRFSSGIVRTTQGTAQGSPGILRNNPILISDKVIGKPVLRGALSPGPFTMARSFSQWGRGFSKLWSEATPERRRQMVNSGPDFDMAARGFVTTTNPEFDNQSPLVQVYEEFTAKAKDNPDYAVNSFDQLVDELAKIAIDKGLFPSEVEAKPQIEATLMNDIGKHVSAIQAQYAEEKLNPDVPQTVAQFASSQNAFTKARKTMVAPDPYYDYTLTHDSDRINFVGAGYQLFQMRIISSLEALREALDNQQIRWDKEIADLYAKGKMTKEQAQSAVEKRTAKEIGEQRFSYEQLLEHKQRIEKMIKQLNELVIDVRNPNDSNLLKALTRFHGLLSAGLLSNPTAIGNNLAGGIFAAKAVTLRNIGMGNQFYSPRGHAYLVKATVSKLLRAFPGDTAIGKLARSNLPLVNDLAGWVHDMLGDQIELERAAEAAGLITTADLKNRSIARGKLPTTAGQIDYSKPSKAGKVVNALGSIPYLRGSLAHLREKIPGMFDRFMNTNNARFYQNTVFKSLQSRAIRAFTAREAIAARSGVSLDELNDFTREANLLTPKELKMPKYSGIRDSGRLRQLFSSVGSLDAFLLDYYNRWKAAPDAEKANVPLFPDQADEFEVIHELESHENIATSGFTPLSMQGVGQRGLLKKFLFMFKNYPTRMFTQMSRLLATDPRDPKGRKLAAWWAVISVVIISAIAGILGREVFGPIQQAITGRSPSAIKLANVLENPDASMIMRYIGMGLAGNLPYYGQVISQILGNPGYGSILDVADYIPGLGLIKDAGKTISKISQTGDAVFPLVDFASRWFPPVSPALRLLPGVEGDIEAKNAARALRVVGPSAGIELAGGGGAPSTQSPASASIRRLMAAAFQGDQAGVQKAFDEAVAEKRAQGSADPERAVMQAIAAREPSRQVYGRPITPAEEAQAVALMSPGQRASYANAQNAFSLINATLGTKYSLTSTPRARTPGLPGQPSRRSLTGTTVPSFARNRLRITGARRRPFGHLSIRGAQRKSKRRSPARFSFSA